jgi:hypothetical protein
MAGAQHLLLTKKKKRKYSRILKISQKTYDAINANGNILLHLTNLAISLDN